MNFPRFAGRFDFGSLEYERPRRALADLPPEAKDTYTFTELPFYLIPMNLIWPMLLPYKNKGLIWTL
jgi:hypothetical protein